MTRPPYELNFDSARRAAIHAFLIFALGLAGCSSYPRVETIGSDASSYSEAMALARSGDSSRIRTQLYQRFGLQLPPDIDLALADYQQAERQVVFEDASADSVEAFMSASDKLNARLLASGYTSSVTVETKSPGATVRYIPAFFFFVKGEANAERFADPTTPSKETAVSIGRYKIWTERDRWKTSDPTLRSWIVDKDVNIWVQERVRAGR